MAYTNPDNAGALFKNGEKIADKHPDYNGSAIISGRAYWLAAWIKTSQKGVKYMSLSLTPKTKDKSETKPADKPAAPPPPPPPPSTTSRPVDPDADDDDSLPF